MNIKMDPVLRISLRIFIMLVVQVTITVTDHSAGITDIKNVATSETETKLSSSSVLTKEIDSIRAQYFVTTDIRRLTYRQEGERNIQIEQIRKLWCQVLVSDNGCASMQFFSWNVSVEQPKRYSPTSIKDTTYFVIASPKPKPDLSDESIKNKFEQLLRKNGIWGVSFTVTGAKGKNIIPDTPVKVPGNSTPFALIDSVWMTYQTNDAKSQLVQQLTALWKTALGSAPRLELHVIQVTPKSAPEFGSDPVKVEFLVFGEGLTAVDVDLVKLKIRQLIASAHIPALLGTPFQWSSDSKSAASSDAGLNLNGVTTITHNNILAYATNDERDQGVELVRKLWAFILNAPLTTVDITLNMTTKIASLGPLIGERQITNCSFVVQCTLKDLNVDTVEAKQKFQRLLDLSSLAFMVDTPVPVVNLTSIFGYVSVNQDMFWMPANAFVVQNGSVNSTTAKELSNPKVYLLHDKICVHNATVETSSLFLQPLYDLWKEALGNDAVEVQIALSNREATSESVLNVSYTVIFVSDVYSWDLEAAKTRFRQLATGTTESLYVKLEPVATQLPSGILEYTRSNTKILVLFDTVNLAYQTDKVPSTAEKALEQAWISVIGPKAWNVRFSVYHAGTEQSFSLAGDQGIPIIKLYFRVEFYCNVSEWNTTALKVKFREIVPSVRNSSLLLSVADLDVITVTTTPASTTVTAGPSSTEIITTPSGTVIHDTVVFSYPNEAERNRILIEMRTLWAQVLAKDVYDVRLTVTTDTILPSTNQSENSSKGEDSHEISYSVIPSSTQKIDVSAAKLKFQGLVQNSTIFKLRDSSIDFLPEDEKLSVGRRNSSRQTDTECDSGCRQAWPIFSNDKEKVIYSYVVYGELLTTPSRRDVLPKIFNINLAQAVLESAPTKTYLTVLNEGPVPNNGSAYPHRVRYAATALSSNGSLKLEEVFSAVEKTISAKLGQDVVFLFVNGSAYGKEFLSVVVDSVQIPFNGHDEVESVMGSLHELWKNASGLGNVSSVVDLDVFNKTFAPLSSVTRNETVLEISYVIRVTERSGYSSTSANFQESFLALYGTQQVNMANKIYREMISLKRTNGTNPVNPADTSVPTFLTDSIKLQCFTTAERDLSLGELGKLWAVSLGIQLDTVRVFPLSVRLLKILSQESTLYQIPYAVVYSTEKPVNLTAANMTFHAYLSNAYQAFVADQLEKSGAPQSPTDIQPELSASYFSNGATFPEIPLYKILSESKEFRPVKPYIIQDTLRLQYENITMRDKAFTAFQEAWAGVLGSAAMFVRLAVYEEFPPYVNDSISGGKMHQIYYAVIILSRKYDIDFPAKQEQFRDFIMDGNIPFVVNFDQVFPIPEPEPLSIFTVVEASNSTSFINLTSSRDVEDAVTTLYEISIGNDARLVRAWSYDETTVTVGKNNSLTTRYQVVLVISNNTQLTPQLVEQKFRDLLLMTSVSAIQTAPSTKALMRALMDNDTNIMEDIILVGFRDSVRLDANIQSDHNETTTVLRQAWARALDSKMSNITISLDTTLPEMLSPDSSSYFVLQYTVLGLLNASVLDVNAARSQVSELFQMNTTTTSTTTTTAIPILLP